MAASGRTWVGSSPARPSTTTTTELLAYVPDLRKDKFHLWISKYHWVPMTVLGLVLLLAIGGWPMVMWGVFLRTVVPAALDLVREFGDAHVGLQALRHR